MGIWYCNICDYICPKYRCNTNFCYNNLCNNCFRIYKNNLRNYIINKNLKSIIPKEIWDNEEEFNSYLCKEYVQIKIQKRKQLEFE